VLDSIRGQREIFFQIIHIYQITILLIEKTNNTTVRPLDRIVQVVLQTSADTPAYIPTHILNSGSQLLHLLGDAVLLPSSAPWLPWLALLSDELRASVDGALLLLTVGGLVLSRRANLG
jgi:hypothetical protein